MARKHGPHCGFEGHGSMLPAQGIRPEPIRSNDLPRRCFGHGATTGKNTMKEPQARQPGPSLASGAWADGSMDAWMEWKWTAGTILLNPWRVTSGLVHEVTKCHEADLPLAPRSRHPLRAWRREPPPKSRRPMIAMADRARMKKRRLPRKREPPEEWLGCVRAYSATSGVTISLTGPSALSASAAF